MTRYSGLLLFAVCYTYIAPGTSKLTLQFEPFQDNKLGAVNISIQLFDGAAPFTPVQAEPYKCQGVVLGNGTYVCDGYNFNDDDTNSKIEVYNFRLQYERKNDGKETVEPEAVLTELYYYDEDNDVKFSNLNVKMRDGSVADIYYTEGAKLDCATVKCDGENHLCEGNLCQCSDSYRPVSNLITEGELRCGPKLIVKFDPRSENILGAVNISIEMFNGSTTLPMPNDKRGHKCNGYVVDQNGTYECSSFRTNASMDDIKRMSEVRLGYWNGNSGVLSEIHIGDYEIVGLSISMRQGSAVDIYPAAGNAKMDCTTKCVGKNLLCEETKNFLTCQCSDDSFWDESTESELVCWTNSTPIVQSALLLINVLIWKQFF